MSDDHILKELIEMHREGIPVAAEMRREMARRQIKHMREVGLNAEADRMARFEGVKNA